MPSRARRRHATPSGPWPFLDVGDEVDIDRMNDPDSHLPMIFSPCVHERLKADDACWCKYPQALFPNWTATQQRKSKIAKVIERATGPCTVHYVDVFDDGTFVSQPSQEVQESTENAYWSTVLRGRPEGVRCRALFVDHLSGPVLQMLGTRYNIEPFFFSSSLGWIPSQYQSNIVDAVGDHITITLTFMRTVKKVPPNPNQSVHSVSTVGENDAPKPMIDTQAPLSLDSSQLLLAPDLLALHMVRSTHGNTIISYHPSSDHQTTTAEDLHQRFTLTGRSVYWSTIFQQTDEPTLLFLSLLWYALYCWDEAFEALYSHICSLESQVIVTNEMDLTTELHAIRAHLLHYESLLDDFRKTVTFVQETSYPGLDDPARYPPDLKEASQRLLKSECENLLREIGRLDNTKEQHEWRLKNVMNLAFSMVNIEDSKRTRQLTATGVRDSAAVRQIHYLFMIFLPGAFVAEAFKMNVQQVSGKADNPGLHSYVATAVPLTGLTIWLIVAYQFQIKLPEFSFGKWGNGRNAGSEGLNTGNIRYDSADSRAISLWMKLCWPITVIWSLFQKSENRKNRNRRR